MSFDDLVVTISVLAIYVVAILALAMLALATCALASSVFVNAALANFASANVTLAHLALAHSAFANVVVAFFCLKEVRSRNWGSGNLKGSSGNQGGGAREPRAGRALEPIHWT